MYFCVAREVLRRSFHNSIVPLFGRCANGVDRLMGQDDIYLQVVARDLGEPQHNNARRVYNLLQKGKHWVLVTLLLGNVIVNETLPVVLDRCLGGGVAAVVGSTVLIGGYFAMRSPNFLSSVPNRDLPQSSSVRSFRSPSVFDMACKSAVSWPSLSFS
jgi:hypothetical protein